jgi:hypothetical protein
MTCQEYLALHSELIDGGLPEADAARCRVHAADCATCARYDRVVRRGLRLVRDIPDVLPSYDFHARLQHRIFHLQDDAMRPDRLTAPGAAIAVMIAGLLAFAAWAPYVMDGPQAEPTEQIADVTNESAAVGEEQSAEPAIPEWWFDGGARSVFSSTVFRAGAGMDVTTAFPGPYSPLIVLAPYGGVGARPVIRYNE